MEAAAAAARVERGREGEAPGWLTGTASKAARRGTGVGSTGQREGEGEGGCRKAAVISDLNLMPWRVVAMRETRRDQGDETRRSRRRGSLVISLAGRSGSKKAERGSARLAPFWLVKK